MENVITANDRKISVSFSRKISDGNYGTTEATAWVQGELGEQVKLPGDISIALGDLFLAATAAVFEQLGITYTMSEDGTLVPDPISPAVTIPQVQAAFGATDVSATYASSDTSDIRIMNPSESPGPLPDWIVKAAGKDGVKAVWDNRNSAAASPKNLPHFKEAVARGATGKGKDGDPKAYWPPK